MALVNSKEVEIGWKLPQFSLPSTDGVSVSPSNYLDKKGLLVVFTCNHCPYAKAAWPILQELHKQYGTEVQFLAINSNDADNYLDDSFEAMKDEARSRNIEFPYLFDETQYIAKDFSAQCTPDSYLFKNTDGVFSLYYHGRINDNWQDASMVQDNSLEDAIKDLINGNNPSDEFKPSMGCSIKWK